MKDDSVPGEDRVLRYVGGRHVDEDIEGNAIVLGGGFIARPREGNRPSCNWLEILGGSLDEQVRQVRHAARIEYGATAKLARLNVGSIIREVAAGTEDRREITVIHDPLDADDEHPAADPSHALMTNVPDVNDPEGERVGDLIANCVVHLFPARPR